MTSGERWTVYPLLFLALGLAVRAALVSEDRSPPPFKALEADRIECREILIRDADGAVIQQFPPVQAE